MFRLVFRETRSLSISFPCAIDTVDVHKTRDTTGDSMAGTDCGFENEKIPIAVYVMEKPRTSFKMAGDFRITYPEDLRGNGISQ